MLEEVQARGTTVARSAAERARERVARTLSEALPGVHVALEGDRIVLFGRLKADDPQLRWLASWLR